MADETDNENKTDTEEEAKPNSEANLVSLTVETIPPPASAICLYVFPFNLISNSFERSPA